MNFLGHRNIKNALLYVQLEETLFKGNDDYVCKAAGNAEEAKALVEVGFDYVCTTPEGIMLFRKRRKRPHSGPGESDGGPGEI